MEEEKEDEEGTGGGGVGGKGGGRGKMKRRGLYRFLTRFFVGGREGWRGGFCFSPFFSLLGGVVVGVLRHSRRTRTTERQQSTEHRQQSTEHRAQSTEHRAQSTRLHVHVTGGDPIYTSSEGGRNEKEEEEEEEEEEERALNLANTSYR